MDNLETKTSAQPDLAQLQAQYDSLRHLVVSLLVLLFVVSGTLNLYLLRQVKNARNDLGGIRPQVAQMVAEYKKVREPAMNDFLKKLTDYAKGHPDFVPVLAKYGVRPNAATGAPSAAAMSPSATPPKASPPLPAAKK